MESGLTTHPRVLEGWCDALRSPENDKASASCSRQAMNLEVSLTELLYGLFDLELCEGRPHLVLAD
jgi:hypothetical protein